MMGSIAAELADEIVLTDDNPRTEDPARIIEQIAAGIDTDVPVRRIPKRARAIAIALEEAGPGDLVLIAGKGHEELQTYGTVAHPFSDRAEVARPVGGRRLAVVAGSEQQHLVTDPRYGTAAVGRTHVDHDLVHAHAADDGTP